MTRTQIRLGLVVGAIVTLGTAVVVGCSEDEPTSPRTTSSGSTGSNTSGGTSGTSGGTSSGGTSGTTPATKKAKATIAATGVPNQTPSGTVDFEQTGTGATASTKVTVNITGATPGEHGVHIHANGSCAGQDNDAGLGAGGHWNPLDAGHSATAGSGHMGDLGNITIAADGTGKLEVTSTAFSIDGTYSVIGKAVIFHANPDNGAQPVGNAGARPGCGVIAAAP